MIIFKNTQMHLHTSSDTTDVFTMSAGGLSRLVPLTYEHADRAFSSVLRATEFMMLLGSRGGSGTAWRCNGYTAESDQMI